MSSAYITICCYFVFSLGVMSEALASRKSKTKEGKMIYEENLSLHRVEFEKTTPKIKKMPTAPLSLPLDQTNQLEVLLRKRKEAYQQLNCIKGYTIQVYMGSSRTEALKAKDWATTFVMLHTSELHYRQPYYTVRIGFFLDRLEAYFVYLSLLKHVHANNNNQFISLIIRPIELKMTCVRD